eukprot:scaffold186690_cov21-Cyclotella_meneghiniana.AAC.1
MGHAGSRRRPRNHHEERIYRHGHLRKSITTSIRPTTTAATIIMATPEPTSITTSTITRPR